MSLPATFFDRYIGRMLSTHRSTIVSTTLLLTLLLSFLTLSTLGHTAIYNLSTYLSPPTSLARATPFQNTTVWGQADFQKLSQIQLSFTSIVDSASGGSELGRSLKLSEMAVSDLGMVVKHSSLTCKTDLSYRLNRYSSDARTAVDQMLHFSSRVGGSMDSILSADTRSLQNLRRLDSQLNNSPRLLAHLTSFLTLRPRTRLPAHTQREIDILFSAAAEKLESVLRELIALGRNIASVLDELSQQLRVIHEVIASEFAFTETLEDLAHHEATLMQLWRKISGANQERKNFQNNANLLRDVAVQQSMAKGYVEDALFNLLKMNADLEAVRHRVAEPMLGGVEEERELGEHVEAMRRVVEVLEEKRSERDARVRVWNSVFVEGEIGS